MCLAGPKQHGRVAVLASGLRMNPFHTELHKHGQWLEADKEKSREGVVQGHTFQPFGVSLP